MGQVSASSTVLIAMAPPAFDAEPETVLAAVSDAARAAGHAVGAALLHPLPSATQVKHILRSAAHAARAFELSAGDDPAVGADQIARSRILAPPVVVDVLRRYPSAPSGGGRVGELIPTLDASLRRPATDR